VTAKIVIAGAGSIGCYVGGCLALAGKTVTFLARGRVAAALARDGLRVTDLDGRDHRFAAGSLSVEIDPANALSSADIVLVTVKSGATLDMAGLVDRYAPSAAVVISLQNGVENASRIAAAFATPRTVLAGMVPFNVVLTERAGEPLRVHRATAGHILVESGKADLAAALSVEGLPVETCADMKSVLWGKLLLNLNNALNALSDKPLKVELSDGRWRKLLAVQMEEALAAMRAASIQPAKLAGVSPTLLPTILRLPDWLFSRVARRMLAIDPQARSSMWEDLVHHRATEIDEFQGAILRLAAAAGTQAPVTERVIARIRDAERKNAGPPALEPDAV